MVTNVLMDVEELLLLLCRGDISSARCKISGRCKLSVRADTAAEARASEAKRREMSDVARPMMRRGNWRKSGRVGDPN